MRVVTAWQPEPSSPDEKPALSQAEQGLSVSEPALSQAEPGGSPLPGMADLDALAAGLDAVDATLARLDRSDDQGA